MTRRLFLLRFLLWLDKERIRWAILRNYEQLPGVVPDDLDILIEPRGLKQVERGLALLGKGMRRLRKINRNAHTQYLLFSEDELDSALQDGAAVPVLQLDFVTAVAWEGMEYLSLDGVLSRRTRLRSLWVLGPDDHAAHLLGHALLDKGEIKQGYHRRIGRRLTINPEFWRSFEDRVGMSSIEEMKAHWGRQDVRGMREAFIYGLSSPLVRGVKRSIFAFTKRARQLRAIVRPPGRLIAAVGPDGSGKTTLLSLVAIVLADGFDPVRTEYMGWREFLLPTKRILTWIQKHRPKDIQTTAAYPNEGISPTGGDRPGPQPVDEPPPPWTHNLSLLHYAADLHARLAIRIRPNLARGGLVLCDRYFFDLLLHRVWISDAAFPSAILRRFSPMPNLLVFFDGDPNVISERKGELTPTEVARQLAVLRPLLSHRNAICLDVSRPVRANVKDVILRLSQPLDEGVVNS